METIRAFTEHNRDSICAVLQLLICLAAVILALRVDQSTRQKENEKLLRARTKLCAKELKASAKDRAKLRRETSRIRLQALKRLNLS